MERKSFSKFLFDRDSDQFHSGPSGCFWTKHNAFSSELRSCNFASRLYIYDDEESDGAFPKEGNLWRQLQHHCAPMITRILVQDEQTQHMYVYVTACWSAQGSSESGLRPVLNICYFNRLFHPLLKKRIKGQSCVIKIHAKIPKSFLVNIQRQRPTLLI